MAAETVEVSICDGDGLRSCTEQRRAYFQRCRPREEAMKGGRGSEGDEDGGGAS